MSARTKGGDKVEGTGGTPPSLGGRVNRKTWARNRHKSDEELIAGGIPPRMLRRLRKKEA